MNVNNVLLLVASITGMSLSTAYGADAASTHDDSPISGEKRISHRQKAVLYGNPASSQKTKLVEAKRLIGMASEGGTTSERRFELLTKAMTLCNKVLTKRFTGSSFVMHRKLERDKIEARRLLNEIESPSGPDASDSAHKPSVASRLPIKK